LHENIIGEIRNLHQLGASLEEADSIDVVLSAAAEAVARLLPCDRVSLIEIDTRLKRVGFFARGGAGSSHVETAVGYAELEQGLAGWVLKHGQSALSPQGTPDPRESEPVRRRRLETECGSIVVVPLRVGNSTLGTMTAINGVTDREFNVQDVELMEMFADYCAIIIQNSRNYLKLKASGQEVATLNTTLQKRNSLKDRLFTVLAHDLRGPVGNTAVIIDMVVEQARLDGDMGRILKLGAQAAHQTYNLLENLLSWVRSQMEGVGHARIQVHLREVLENVAAWLGPQASKKGLSISVECSGDLEALTDRATLETIVRNLVANAVKYSSPAGWVVLRGQSEPAELVIDVEDFGQGMDPTTLSKVFGHEKMESRNGTAGETGNGLGLMFCADLATSLGARLEAESQVGKGSTFRLRLPNPGPLISVSGGTTLDSI